MDITIENWQRKLKIDRHALVRHAEALAGFAGVSLGSLTVIVVDDAGCAPINEAAVGHAGPTDVITLSYDAIPGDEASAEIVLNAECAAQQRPEDPWRELVFYLAHAFNHLSGRDDDTPEKRTAMHRRERRWLARLLPTANRKPKSAEGKEQVPQR
jgi:rRNA maturation RNase YbeY